MEGGGLVVMDISEQGRQSSGRKLGKDGGNNGIVRFPSEKGR